MRKQQWWFLKSKSFRRRIKQPGILAIRYPLDVQLEQRDDVMIGKTLSDQLVETFGSEDFLSELQAAVAIWKKEGVDPNTQEVVYKLAEFDKLLESVDKSYLKADGMIAFANQWVADSAEELNFSNQQIAFLNKAITTMFNSLDQGFLIVDSAGIVTQFASRAAKNFLGLDPVGKHISEVFKITEDNRESFLEWYSMVFEEVIHFDNIIALGPKELVTSDESQKIEVAWKPIRSHETEKIEQLIIIFNDVSEKYAAESSLQRQKVFTEMVIKYINGKANFVRMIQMTRETAELMKAWEFSEEYGKASLDYLTRELHTLKGGLNTLSMDEMGSMIHDYESDIKLSQERSASFKETEKMVRGLGHDLIEGLNKFLAKYKRVFKFDVDTSSFKEVPTNNVYKFSEKLLRGGMTDLLRSYVKEIVEVPALSLFAPIESNVFTKSLQLGKNVELQVKDPKEIRVIPEFYMTLFEQLTHIFNNMVDHGIELPEQRLILKKNPIGVITVSVDIIEATNLLQFVISDDGKGIDPSEIRTKLDKAGVDNLSEVDEQVIYHIFDQGFTTRDLVSDTSGRGVGMAAFFSALKEMNGSLKLSSVVGKGTTFEITVPYIRDLDSEMIERNIKE